jgi:hypothetical protein
MVLQDRNPPADAPLDKLTAQTNAITVCSDGFLQDKSVAVSCRCDWERVGRDRRRKMLAANERHDSRVHRIAPLPFLIDCCRASSQRA